jgi:hypothetical protein
VLCAASAHFIRCFAGSGASFRVKQHISIPCRETSPRLFCEPYSASNGLGASLGDRK